MSTEWSPAGLKRVREYRARQNKAWAKKSGTVRTRFVDPATLKAGEPVELRKPEPPRKRTPRPRRQRPSAKTRQQVAEMNAALDRVARDEAA